MKRGILILLITLVMFSTAITLAEFQEGKIKLNKGENIVSPEFNFSQIRVSELIERNPEILVVTFLDGEKKIGYINQFGGIGEDFLISQNQKYEIICKEALEIYQSRMKIEESFKDLKSLLHLDKIMNKSQEYLEKMIALVMLAYAIGLLIGEKIRAVAYKGKKGKDYSGFFIFIKHLRQVAKDLVHAAIATALASIKALVWGLVPFYV